MDLVLTVRVLLCACRLQVLPGVLWPPLPQQASQTYPTGPCVLAFPSRLSYMKATPHSQCLPHSHHSSRRQVTQTGTAQLVWLRPAPGYIQALWPMATWRSEDACSHQALHTTSQLSNRARWL